MRVELAEVELYLSGNAPSTLQGSRMLRVLPAVRTETSSCVMSAQEAAVAASMSLSRDTDSDLMGSAGSNLHFVFSWDSFLCTTRSVSSECPLH